MTVCAIKVCRNYKGRLKNTKHVTYHRIPNNPIIRNKWIDRIRKSREDATWNPTKNTVVCSVHFGSKDMYTVNKTGRRRLTKKAVPRKALFLSSVKSSDTEDSDDKEIEEKSNSNEAGPSVIFVQSHDMCFKIEPSEDIDQVPNNDKPDVTINDKTVEVQNKNELDDEKSNSNEAGPSVIFVQSHDMCFKIEPSEDIDQVPNNDKPDVTINDKTVEVQNKTELDDEKSNSNEAGPSVLFVQSHDMCFKIEPLEDIDQVPNNDEPDVTINDKTVEVQNKTELDEEDFSDLDSVYDSPQKAKLRRDLRRKIALERKHRLKLKSLRQKNRRLEKKLASFKQIVETLKKERFCGKCLRCSIRQVKPMPSN